MKDEYISKTLLIEAISTDIAIPHNERCAQLLEAILNAPKVNVREIEYAEWYYDPNGMDWGLGLGSVANVILRTTILVWETI